jgi:serine protease Do
MGVRVNGITPDTAAEDVGIEVGDIILVYDGVEIEDDDHLINQVKLTPINKEVALTLYRDGRTVELKTKVGASTTH